MNVKSRRLRVVVQHLLEMRNAPIRISRIPVESSTNLVVHSAHGHLTAGVFNHFQRVGLSRSEVMPEQELKRHRGRELRRSAEATANRVIASRDGFKSRLQKLGVNNLARF